MKRPSYVSKLPYDIARMEGIATLDMMLDDVKEAQRITNRLTHDFKNGFRDTVESLVTDYPDKRQELLNDFYWDARFEPGQVLAAFGEGNKSPLIIPQKTNVLCHVCGAPLLATSRNNLREMNMFPDPLCKHCQALEEKQRNKEWLAEQGGKDKRQHGLDTMSYQEYLQTPEWKEMRVRKLRSVRGRCQACNKKGKVHVHHRIYERRGCERLNDLTVLCEDCHELFHEQRDLEAAGEDTV